MRTHLALFRNSGQVSKAENYLSGFARKILCLIPVSILAISGLFSQSFLIPVDAPTNVYPITFTDLAQKTLVLHFTKPVTPGSNMGQLGWSVSGTSSSIYQIDASGTNVIITLSAPITFAERTTVNVSYDAASGNFQMIDSSEPNFTNVSAVNNYIAVAADFTNGLYGETPPIDICAPVENVLVESNITITPRYRNSINYQTPRIYIRWQYPLDTYKTQNVFTEQTVGSGIYQITEAYSLYPDNTSNCTWEIQMFPYLLNIGNQPLLMVTQNAVILTIPNYKKDNGTPVPGTGSLALNPAVNDPATLICAGNSIAAFIFTDATVFDCQLGVEPNRPNIANRYVQYVYGTQSGQGIPNVFINVFGTTVQITDLAGNSISGTWTVDPTNGATVAPYTTPSGFFEGPVIQYQWDGGGNLITPLAQTYLISHIGNIVTDLPNSIFDVTLRNWGPCNPWSGDFYLSDPPVTEYSRLRIIEAPPAPVVPDKIICLNGDKSLTVTSTPVGIFEWYSDVALTTMVATGPIYSPTVSLPGTYDYWVADFNSPCRSTATKVTLTINENPVTSSISGEAMICETATNKVYSVTDHPGSSYSWTVPSSLSITSPTNLYFLIVNAVPGQSLPGDKITVTETITATGCTGPLIEFPIVVSEIIPAESVVGPNLGCRGASGLTYSVTNHSGSSYSWSVPSGANITSDPGLNTITVGFPSSVSGNISVTETNGACTTIHLPLSVTINPLPVPSVSGPASLRISASNINYSTEASMTNYLWTVSPGGTITSGTGSNIITVTWNNPGNQSVGINYQNTYNCTAPAPVTFPVNIYPLPSVDNVQITGSLSVGSVITGNYNYNDRGVGTEGTSTYRWIRDGSIVVGTGISYTIDNADLNKTLAFEVTPVSTMGIPYSGMPVSSPSVSIENLLEIPVASEVCIEGTRAAGNILRGKYKFTHSRPEGNSTYKWYNGLNSIPSATTMQYTLTPQDIADNSEISFEVTPVSSNSVPVTGPTVSSIPMAMITLPQSDYSDAINEVVLTAAPLGGIFAGSYVMNGKFSPRQAGAGGPYNVQYFHNIVNTTVSCFQQASKQLMVIPNSTLFSGFDSVYCKQGSSDLITVSGAPPTAAGLGFTLSDPDAIISQTEWTVTIDPAKMNAGIKKDILTFHYSYGGYDYYITHPFKVDSVGPISQIVNLNPGYCSNSPKQNINVSGVYPSGGTGLWTGSILSDINGTSASVDPSLGTSGMTYPVTYQYTSPLGCKSNILSYNVSINQSPESLTISTSDPLQLCLGESANLSVTNTPGYNYQWKRGGVSVGSNLNTYEAISAGNYSVVVSNSSGCTANSVNSVDILDVNSQMTTTFRLSGPTSFCQGNSVIMSVSDNPAYSFQWIKDGTNIDQATTNSFTVTNSGIYSLVVMNSGGCKNKTEDINVNVSALPVAPIINAGGPVQFCQGDSVILSVSNIPGYSYRWKLNEIPAGTSLNSFTAKNPGIYSLAATNSAGCSTTSVNTINVTVNPKPVASVSLNGPSSFCQGSSVLLSVQKDSTNSYQWLRNGSGIEDGRTNSYAAKDQGTYSLIITSTQGCIHRTGDVTLNVHEAPVAPAISTVGPLELCLGDSTTLSVPGTDGYFYQWRRNGQPVASGLTSIVARNAGTYTLVVSNSAGCSVNATNNIELADVNSQVTTTFKVSGPTSFCSGSSVDLSVNDNSNYRYQWVKDGSNITGATTNFYSTQDSGVYYLNVTNSNGCKNKTEDVEVVVYSTPATPLISSVGPLENCQGDSVILSVTNTPGYSYQWKLNGGAIGSDSSQFIAKNSGSYTLSVANKMGCSVSSTNTVTVTVNPLPVIGTISQIGNDTKFCRGESITLSVPPNDSYSYSWKNKTAVVAGETTNLFIARETGEYTVEVLSLFGCKKTADPVKIDVVEMPAMPSIDKGIYFPDICLGENPLRLSVKDSVAGYNYKWYKNGTPYSVSKYIDIQEGGNYYLEANIDICTSARDSLVVKSMETLPKPDITAHGSTVWHLSTTSKANYYKWYYNGSAIPDADKKMYVAYQNLGIYRVGISDDMLCFSLSDTVRIPTNITGIEDNEPFENIKIFPNPTTGLITIEINNNIYGELEIDILTINGLKIRNIKSDKISDYFVMEIDLTDYSSGMYIINLSVGKYFATRKIILR